MGGRLTVSSREHYGSTFTFILPYKVSNTCDSSDDADELSDMANHDGEPDDTTESYFQFQPRTLGSLFNSNGTSRTPKLLPHKIGYTSLHKLNGLPGNSYSFPYGNSRPKESVSLEDSCSSIGVAETSPEPETSESQGAHPDIEDGASRSIQCRDDSNNKLQNSQTDQMQQGETSREMDVAPNIAKSQEGCQTQENSDAINSHQISKISTEVKSPALEPKILLVEDNKINVMVTQSMMKQLGHSIDVVNNGVEAVLAVQRRSYSLVFMVILLNLQSFLFLFLFSQTRILKILAFIHYCRMCACPL